MKLDFVGYWKKWNGKHLWEKQLYKGRVERKEILEGLKNNIGKIVK